MRPAQGRQRQKQAERRVLNDRWSSARIATQTGARIALHAA
jgi:hypothetical protein